jgi:Tfp pilus assembly protein PilN
VNQLRPLNLLPWREAFYRRRRQQLLAMLVMTVLVSLVVIVIRMHGFWRQSQASDPALTAVLAQQANITDSLQQAQLRYQRTVQQWQGLQQSLHSYARHGQWQSVLAYPEQSPEGMQITSMVLSQGQVTLSGISVQASLVSEFLKDHPSVALAHLQLRSDGWYEFGLVHEQAELTR